MISFRFIFDDFGQCATQKSILKEYGVGLAEKCNAKIIWTSGVLDFRKWEDVPIESSRRLSLRLMALKPQVGQCTVFFPGHIVPGEIDVPVSIDKALAVERPSTLSDLDIFVVNNEARELISLREFLTENMEYDVVSKFAFTATEKLPNWLNSEHVFSCVRLSDRPWYSGRSPMRSRWTRLIQNLIEAGKLDFATINRDIANGIMRPSVLSDIKFLQKHNSLPAPTVCNIDSVFIIPEMKLSGSQYNLLYSKGLQKRIESYAKRKKNKIKKQHRQTGLFPIKAAANEFARKARRLLNIAPHIVHKAFAATSSSFIRWISRRNN